MLEHRVPDFESPEGDATNSANLVAVAFGRRPLPSRTRLDARSAVRAGELCATCSSSAWRCFGFLLGGCSAMLPARLPRECWPGVSRHKLTALRSVPPRVTFFFGDVRLARLGRGHPRLPSAHDHATAWSTPPVWRALARGVPRASGKEFMPAARRGILSATCPVTMPHASIGEALDRAARSSGSSCHRDGTRGGDRRGQARTRRKLAARSGAHLHVRDRW